VCLLGIHYASLVKCDYWVCTAYLGLKCEVIWDNHSVPNHSVLWTTEVVSRNFSRNYVGNYFYWKWKAVGITLLSQVSCILFYILFEIFTFSCTFISQQVQLKVVMICDPIENWVTWVRTGLVTY
jgi:hypothetical protein